MTEDIVGLPKRERMWRVEVELPSGPKRIRRVRAWDAKWAEMEAWCLHPDAVGLRVVSGWPDGCCPQD